MPKEVFLFTSIKIYLLDKVSQYRVREYHISVNGVESRGLRRPRTHIALISLCTYDYNDRGQFICVQMSRDSSLIVCQLRRSDGVVE